jgi:hypothetical protein
MVEAEAVAAVVCAVEVVEEEDRIEKTYLKQIVANSWWNNLSGKQSYYTALGKDDLTKNTLDKRVFFFWAFARKMYFKVWHT